MAQQVEERVEAGARRWRDDWPVAVGAAGAAAATWVVLTQVASVDLAVRSGSGDLHVNLVSVIVTSLVVALAGAWLLRLLERSTPQARTIWTLVAVVVWAASFFGPLGARSLAAGLRLALLHAVVGSVVVIGLRRRHSDRLA